MDSIEIPDKMPLNTLAEMFLDMLRDIFQLIRQEIHRGLRGAGKRLLCVHNTNSDK